MHHRPARHGGEHAEAAPEGTAHVIGVRLQRRRGAQTPFLVGRERKFEVLCNGHLFDNETLQLFQRSFRSRRTGHGVNTHVDFGDSSRFL
jgi:hypothetical protein